MKLFLKPIYFLFLIRNVIVNILEKYPDFESSKYYLSDFFSAMNNPINLTNILNEIEGKKVIETKEDPIIKKLNDSVDLNFGFIYYFNYLILFF